MPLFGLFLVNFSSNVARFDEISFKRIFLIYKERFSFLKENFLLKVYFNFYLLRGGAP